MKTKNSESTFLWKGFWQLADPKIWTASMVPFVLGTSIAVGQGFQLRWPYTFLALVVIILVEIGKNGVNEYFDYLSGADRYVLPEDRTPFSGGKKVIVDGVLSLQQVAWISVICLVSAVFFAIPIVHFNPAIAWFGAAGLFLSIAYSTPPFKLSYRGLGEIAVGLTFGPILVNGAYFLQANKIDIAPVLLSIPLGFLIANVLWINEVPDVEADRQAGKMNLVSRRGRCRAIGGFRLIFLFAYASVMGGSILLKDPIYMIAFLSFPIAIKAIRSCEDNVNETKKLIPANGLTILTYLATGLLLSIATLCQLLTICLDHTPKIKFMFDAY